MVDRITRIWDDEGESYITVETRKGKVYLRMKWLSGEADYVHMHLTTEDALELIEALKLSLPKDV